MKIIHIVRRYGPVGGMERYVWETTLELVKLGHQVQVVCEQCLVEKPQGILVHELGRMRYRPRWLYYWRFSRRVHAWLKAHPQPGWLIHSNERVGVHDVTTFHGPPFASVRDKPWWKKISIRVAMQLWMERRELREAKAIVPNSEYIAKQIAHYYPEYVNKLTNPVIPGVMPSTLRPVRKVPKDAGVIGFVGREWKRKGLSLAVKVTAELRKTRPNLELCVIGPDAGEVVDLFRDWQGGYQLLGWQSGHVDFEKLDVLLHPATAEPYGMVISEAMASKVPVVVSDVCGAAAQVTEGSGAVVSLAAPIDEWKHAVELQLIRIDEVPSFVREWSEVAEELIEIYKTKQSWVKIN